MRPTFEQTADDLARLDTYSADKIDAIVDAYLVGFGPQTATMRIQLADTFKSLATSSELSQRISQRIRRA